ncbi:TPA: glycosyltransferase [Aeromonas salmonicida]|nr:glycosyltransferase [Aeromonas salmonicida]
MISPLVSIVIPSYNHDKYIKDCIKGIIEQDYEKIELLIIDDGSTDNSMNKIKELEDSCKKRFVRFEFRTRPNKGLCATLNEAIKWCKGDFYSAIASDDIMLSHKTSRQVEHLMKNPTCDAVFGGANIIDDMGNVVRTKMSKRGSFKFEDIFLMRHSLSAPTQMIRLIALRNAGQYPSGIYIEDWYMWLKLTSLGSRVDDLGEIVVNYRRHETNISLNLERMNAARTELIELYNMHPLYRKAKATIALSSAMDIQPFSKIKSIRYIIISLSETLTILFDKRFYRFFVKMFIPKFMKKYLIG